MKHEWRTEEQIISVLQPHFGLPMRLDIDGARPFGDGVSQAGGIGFL